MPSIGLGLGLGFNRPSGLTFPDDWGRKAAIVVDNTKVAGATNLVDFPVRLTVDNLPWHIMFGMDGSQVSTTIVGGKVLMRNRELTTLDEEMICARSRELAAAVWQRL